MKRRGLLALGFGVYALTLIATAPATLIDAGLRRAGEGRLRLVEARGTLWSGSGQIEIRDAGGRAGIARSLTWDVAPGSFLRGQLGYEVGLEQPKAWFPVTVSPFGIELANARIELPASVLGLGVPRLAALGLTGDVRIHVANLSIARDSVVGHATLQWLAAGSTLTPVSPLGDYEVRLDGKGRTVEALLRTIEGSLRLDGTGSWTQGRPPTYLATAQVARRHRQQLVPLLQLIAVERSAGHFELRLD